MTVKVGPLSMKEFKGLFLELSRRPEVRSMCMAKRHKFMLQKQRLFPRDKACRKGLNQGLQGVQDIIHSL